MLETFVTEDTLFWTGIGEVSDSGIPKKGKYNLINKEGKEVIPVIYDKAGSFEDGKSEVVIDGNTFYINPKGEKIE